MAKLAGTIYDEATGQPVAARVQAIGSHGLPISPAGALHKVGPGEPFFYADGTFEIEVPRGNVRITVERGTEYVPIVTELYAPAGGTETVEIELKRWTSLSDRGRHPGNTHLHYDENEARPDDRLRLDSRIEDLRMTAVSILKQWDLGYASNKYPTGMLTEFSTEHHHIQCGEETRHNVDDGWTIGYGHVMLLNLRNAVDPISRGVLVDAFDPDYPPLTYACDGAHEQGGIVIWCHNGQGMEAPVAAVLGKLDAFNLFDPSWNDPEYDIYYRMLNAGLRLPASTGTDWFVCSGNRVYVGTSGPFEYDSWLGGLKEGRTFITNGPSLSLTVDGMELGEEVQVDVGGMVPASAEWESHYTISQVEIVVNGQVHSRQSFPDGSRSGRIETDIQVASDAWVAARLFSESRDSYFQPIFAHTSPIYVACGVEGEEKRNAAAWFDDAIEESLEWVKTKGRFYTDRQRQQVLELFREGQAAFRRMK